MGLFKTDKKVSKQKSYSTSGILVEGNLALPIGTQCGIYANTDELTITKLNDEQAPSYHLKYSSIKNIGTISATEIIEKNKSVIGRAVVGGLLIGSLGAVICGISGMNHKQKKETTYYMVINYLPLDSGELQTISFQVSLIFTDKLISYIQDCIEQQLPKELLL